MRKIFILFAVVALATTWVGCSDDDDTPKRKLVGKIVGTTEENIYNSEIWEFTYNDDATIKTIKYSYIESQRRSYVDSMTLLRNGDKLIIHNIETTFENGEIVDTEEATATCPLDEQGRIKEFEQGSGASFTYSEAGELIYCSYMNQEWKWEQGNVIFNDEEYAALDIENNTNLDLNLYFGGLRYLTLDGEIYKYAFSDYLGTKCKNLVEAKDEVGYWSCVLDDDGNPIEISESFDKWTFKISYILQ